MAVLFEDHAGNRPDSHLDKDDYVPRGEAYVAGMTGSKPTTGVKGPIDSDKFANVVSEPAVNIRSGDLTNINSVNPGGLATRNSIKGKRQIGDGIGVKKEHAAALKKHKYSQNGCDRDLTNKMLCPRRKLDQIKEISSDSDFEGPMNASGDEDHKANKGAATLKARGTVKPDVINEADGTTKEGFRVNNVLRTRTSPKTLCDTIKGLTVEQKAAVKDIGLEKLIGMKLDGIPIRLGFYVVDRFDSLKMVMHYDRRSNYNWTLFKEVSFLKSS